MKITTKLLIITSLMFVVLAGCQINPHPMDMTSAVQNAKTKDDHESLAAHYEQAAKDAEAKVEEHKKLLTQYKQHNYQYGKQGDMLIQHCEAMIGSYQKIAEYNSEMAKVHHQLAGDK